MFVGLNDRLKGEIILKLTKEIYEQVIKEFSDTGILFSIKDENNKKITVEIEDILQIMSIEGIPPHTYMEWKKNKQCLRCQGITQNGNRCKNFVHKDISIDELSSKWMDTFCKKHEYQSSLEYLSENPDILSDMEFMTGHHG